MTTRLLPALTALAVAAAALVPAGAAVAQDAAPTTVPGIQITKAYAFVDHHVRPGMSYADVVFRTTDALPRRYDGMIRAYGALDGTGHSIASVRGRHGTAAHCYSIVVAIRDGRIAGPHGRKARTGSAHTLKVTARGTGSDIADTARVTLRRARAGDASGRPLGC
jgi:hypothetical protein